MKVSKDGSEESRIEKIRKISSEGDASIDEDDIWDLDTEQGWLAEQYASRLYEVCGPAGPLGMAFGKTHDLRHMIKLLANAGDVRDRADYLDESLYYLDWVELCMLSLGEEEIRGLHDESIDPIEEFGGSHQALLSNREREILKNKSAFEQREVAQVESRIRRRVTNRFLEDIELMRDVAPELHAQIKDSVVEDIRPTKWHHDEFKRGQKVRLENDEVWNIESIMVGNSFLELVLSAGKGSNYSEKTVSASEVVEIVAD